MPPSPAITRPQHPSADWTPRSWQRLAAEQQPTYPDVPALEAALGELTRLPPLVTSWEVNRLRQRLAEAEAGRAFVLQGGDCAESFADCESGRIANHLKVLLQMSLVLVHGLGRPVVRIGRVAGQYAKPRSSDSETRDGVKLPSYRGDNINGPDFSVAARTPDPRRLIEGHARSAMTMNFIRGLLDGGFADLHHPEYWNLDWAQHSSAAIDYRRRVEAIAESLRFMETLAGRKLGEFETVEFFASHEALLLCGEAAQTRQVPRQDGWWNLSTHLPWIGMRTAALDGAHVEYCRGIRNPIGIKIGPAMTEHWLLGLCETLNPQREAGRLVMIHRMGAHAIGAHLPRLIRAMKNAGHGAVWLCDPMHGNTQTVAGGIKTRAFADIAFEVEQAFRIHADCDSQLGGVHLELTGEDVTECIGGARDLSANDLERAYRSTVDPRLNYEQSLELALKIAALAPHSTT